MITEDQVNDFYRHVESLKLKFPVAAVSKATKLTKGNVSQVLSRKQTPSENFLEVFYKSFPKVSDNGNVTDTNSFEKLLAINKTLAESHRVNSDAQKISSEAQLVSAQALMKLIEHNETLVKWQTSKANSDDLQGNALIGSPILTDLLEVLVDLGVGKIWHSKQEGLAALSKRFYVDRAKKQEMDKHADAHS